MAAPTSNIVWGSIAGDYGQIGIYRNVTKSGSTASVNVQVWFWSKYSVTDANNDFLYNVGTNITEATTVIGAVNIKHTVSTGDGWSTSNQTKLIDETYSYTLSKSSTTYKVYAQLNSIDKVGARMYANTTYTVPALDSYTISYNANGGSGAPSSQTKWYGEPLTLSSTTPTRTGYSFQGWATSSSGSVAYAAGVSYIANADVTLYAVWKANTYPVKYDANGGSGAPANQTKTYGQTLKLSTTVPTLTNYNFLGWGTSASATTISYAAGANYTVNAAITLYAIWELAYVKPRITNLSIGRCDNAGLPSDTGLNALISFDWACDQDLVSIVVNWESETGGSGSASIEGSGTSGNVSAVVGNDSLSTESTYSISVVVTDSNGYSYAFGTLNGTKFVIDFLAGGTGAAFGKPAELDGVLDVGFKTRFFGGLVPLVLEPETDLNTVLIPNTYTGENISNFNYENCPIDNGTFTLLVESCGEDGQIRQTFSSCSKYKPERFVRFYYQTAWGDWFWANTDEYVLYENSEGTAEAITLSASVSHYRYMEIYYTDNNGKGQGYTKVWNPNNKVVHLQLQEAGSNVYFRQTAYKVSGTTMTPDITTASYVKVNMTSGAVSVSIETNYIKIVRVIGRA